MRFGQGAATRRKHESRRNRGVEGTRALAHDAMESNHRPGGHVWRRLGRRLSRPAVALAAGALEHGLAFLFERRERRIGIRQRHGACADGVSQDAHSMIGEQHALERRQIVQQLWRRDVLDLGVVRERAQRLLLECRDAGVQLVAALLVRAAQPCDAIIRASEGDIVDRRHAPPHVHERLGRRRVRRWIDQPDIRRQREGDPDETVLPQIAEITGTVAVGAEIIGVDRPEQRIVGIGIELPPQLKQPEPRLDTRWRELEIVGGHVAVGARASVTAQTLESPVEERAEAACDRVAGLAAAVGGLAFRFTAAVRVLPRGRRIDRAGFHQHRQKQTAMRQQASRSCEPIDWESAFLPA